MSEPTEARECVAMLERSGKGTGEAQEQVAKEFGVTVRTIQRYCQQG